MEFRINQAYTTVPQLFPLLYILIKYNMTKVHTVEL